MENINILATIRDSQQVGFQPYPVQTLRQLLFTLFRKCLLARPRLTQMMGREIPERSQAPITLLRIEIHELDKTGVCSLYPQDLMSAWENIHHYHENTKTLVAHCKSWRRDVNNITEMWCESRGEASKAKRKQGFFKQYVVEMMFRSRFRFTEAFFSDIDYRRYLKHDKMSRKLIRAFSGVCLSYMKHVEYPHKRSNSRFKYNQANTNLHTHS